jgi:hypothetical protein
VVPDLVLHVVVGVPVLNAQLPSGPCLLVEGSAERLDAALVSASLIHNNLRSHHGTLTAREGQEIPWYRYSDGRLDGPLGPEIWNHHFSNLSLLDEQVITGITLESLLDDRMESESTNCQIHLSIRQGNPLEILDGAGSWLTSVHYIELLGPKASDLWADATHQWLVKRGFQLDVGSEMAWQRDVLFSQRLEIKALREHQDVLTSRLSQRERQLAEIVQEIDILSGITSLSD